MGKKTDLQIQVQEKLEHILKGQPYFSALPGERELCQMLEVSRPTVRKVLEYLEEEGIIERVQGRGTFYLGDKMPIDYSDQSNHGLGLSSIMHHVGKITKSQVLSREIEAAGRELATRLDIQEGELVFHLKRIRHIDGELYNLADDYIPLALCPEIVEVDFTGASLLKVLEEQQIHPYREEKTIEIVRANAVEAAYLNLELGDPISITRIVTYDLEKRVIQYAISKSDAYKSRFRVTSTVSIE